MQSMDHGSSVFRLLVVAALLISPPVIAATIGRPSIAELVGLAADVAVVELRWEEPIRFEHGGSQFVCGCRYGARIIESFKGEHGEIEFSAATCSLFRGYDRKYLVFSEAVDRSYLEKERARPLLSSETEFQRARQVCVLSASRKVIQSGQAALVAFHEAEDLGGDWLLVEPNNVVSYGPFKRRRLAGAPGDVEVVSWVDVKKEIEEASAESRAQ